MAVQHSISLDRMVRAVEKVRERLLRLASIFDREQIPYAIAGGNAVAAWVSTIDEAAIRNTRDVDVLVRRSEFQRLKAVLEWEGFFHRHEAGLDVFLDSEGGNVRDSVHLIFANEKVREEEPASNPDVTDSTKGQEFQVLNLDALVKIKLTAYRDKDRTHLRDMLDVGLIDATWVARLPPELAHRLQKLIDDPNG